MKKSENSEPGQAEEGTAGVGQKRAFPLSTSPQILSQSDRCTYSRAVPEQPQVKSRAKTSTSDTTAKPTNPQSRSNHNCIIFVKRVSTTLNINCRTDC